MKRKRNTQLVPPDKAKERHDFLDSAIFRFEGQLDELEAAIGMYMIGRHFGWKVLHLIHTKKTIRKYEQILGIEVREEFDEVGADADRSNAWKLAQGIANFWKVVSGDEKLPLEREERRTVT
ncbi:hypothetical protein ABT392_15480 [Paucibacter sp. JuS9]|uniref:hypothetical protein n=1 Tax=Paucibacter sp. JuS9 TaxID=3228748 RepID=UPI0037574B31